MRETGSRFFGRTCADCITFMWGEGGVEGTSRSIGRKKFRSIHACRDAGAVPTPRPQGVMTPCHECDKVKDNAPRPTYYFAEEITERTWRTVQHFDECNAVGQFPDDPIVKWCAAIIKRVLADVARQESHKNLAHMFSVMTLGGM